MRRKLYVITLIVFLGMDALWLGLVAPQFYRSQIGHLMAERPNFLAAGLFYLLFVGALVYFVVEPMFRIGNIQDVLIRGGLFGLVNYATYDLTNLATLRDWPLLVTLVDMLWGTALTAAVAAVSVWVARMLR